MKIPSKQRKEFTVIALFQSIGGLLVLVSALMSFSNINVLLSTLFGIAIGVFSIIAEVAGILGYWRAFALSKWCQWLQIFQIAVGPFRWLLIAGPSLLVGAGIIETELEFTLFQFNPISSVDVGKSSMSEIVQLRLNLIPFIIIHFNALIRNRAIDNIYY